MTETQHCPDCGLDLPLKQFAKYLGKRHPLCRTCLAIDVAEFKSWVLPYVENRRIYGIPRRGSEDWEIAVKERRELSAKDKGALLCRTADKASRKDHRYRGGRRVEVPASLIRPWKFEQQEEAA